ncbi:membrane protein insertion efficiency factor YidD [Roseateles sp. NT4]|uniref:membrane protein insertion efficiency factor YidD n=1 Tax=Roseateles sp. NT4 TaxID=3453715 RepID=UPI003EE8C5B7
MLREPALAAIGIYQRYVSPYKGFCCAYRAHTGGPSCSALGTRVIRRHGLLAGTVLLRRRLRRCGEVYRHFHPTGPRPLAAQRGDCDASCDGPGDGCDGWDCDVCDGCDACDWPDRKRKDKPTASRRRHSASSRWDESADSDASRRRDG